MTIWRPKKMCPAVSRRGHRPALAASNSLRTAPSVLAASSVRATAKRCASADCSTWDDEGFLVGDMNGFYFFVVIIITG